MSRTAADVMTEAEVQKFVLKYAKDRGYTLWRNNKGTAKRSGQHVRFGLLADGSVDLIGIAPDGHFVALELKSPGKKPSDEQKEFLRAVTERGGHTAVCDNITDAVTFINRVFNGRAS